jgi:hypothetical protein
MNDNLGLLIRNPRWADVLINRVRCAAKVRDLTNDRDDKNKESEADREQLEKRKRSPDDERQYILHRLAEIERWERSLGKKTR